VREPLSPKKATVAEAEAATKRSAKDKKVSEAPAVEESVAPVEAAADTTEVEAASADEGDDKA